MAFEFSPFKKEEETTKEEKILTSIPARAKDITDISFELKMIEAALKNGNIYYDEKKKDYVLIEGKREDWIISEEGVKEILAMIKSTLFPKFLSTTILTEEQIRESIRYYAKLCLKKIIYNYRKYGFKDWITAFSIVFSIITLYLSAINRSMRGIGFLKLGYVVQTTQEQ